MVIPYAQANLSSSQLDEFAAIYQQELGSTRVCEQQLSYEYKVCSDVLKSEGNAPYVFQSDTSKGVVVLFHGLSDSPFFMRSIAEYLYREGYTVVVPLTPGHGKLEADADMEDSQLKSRWYAHVNQVMGIVEQQPQPVFIGGFSTGGAFATWYSLHNPDKVKGILLFSAALELTGGAETMSKIWGIKLLAKLLDGDYETQGPHPYKYPSVASYSGLILMDVIRDIREFLKDKTIEKPIFAAHSMADNVTMVSGIESLIEKVDGNHTFFKVDESYDVCHADVVMNQVQIVQLQFNKSEVNENERCAVPKANPQHDNMLKTLGYFMQQHEQG